MNLPSEVLKNPQTPAIGQSTSLIANPSTTSSENHINIDVPLDAFQAKYTTEDNDSYPFSFYYNNDNNNNDKNSYYQAI